MTEEVLEFIIAGNNSSLMKATKEAKLSLASVGKVAGIAGAALAGGLAVGIDKSVKAAISFQTQMTLIQTQAGGTARDVKQLSGEILKLGRTTTQGPVELAKAMFHLKSIGLDNVKAMAALKVVSEGAMVGMSDLEDTTNALAGAIKSGIRGANDFSGAMGILNAGVGAGNMRMTDLVGALSTGFLSTAKNAGLSLRDVAASLADFTRQGVPANQTATRLRTALMVIISPSDKAAGAMKQVGLTGYQVGQAIRHGGIVEAMKLLKEHFDRIRDPVKRFQVETEALGRSKTAGTMMTLMNSVADLGRIYNQVGDKAGSFGQAVKTSAEETANKMKIAKSNFQVLEITIGTGLLPIVSKLADVLAIVAGYFAKHATLAKLLVGALAGLAVALLATAAAAFIVANALTFGIAAAVVGVIAGIALLIKNWGAVKDAMNSVLGWVRSHWPEIATLIAGPFAPLVALATNAFGVRSALTGAFSSVLGWLRDHWREIALIIAGPFAPLVLLATNAFGVRTALVGALEAVKAQVGRIVGDIAGFFVALPARIGTAIVSGATALKNAVTGLFGEVIGWVKHVLGQRSPSTVFYEIGRNVVLGFIHGVGSMAGVLENAVVHMVESIPAKVGGAIAGAVATGGSTKSDLARGIPAAAGVDLVDLKPQVLEALIYAIKQGWHGEVTSGFRSYAKQAELYARYLRGGPLAAPPGHSSHETGSAVDVTDYGTFGRIMASAPGFERLYNYLGARDPVHYSISGYAEGGITSGPSLGLVGESGREAIVPLDSSRGRKALADALKDALAGAGGPALYVENQYVRDELDIELIASRVSRRLALAR